MSGETDLSALLKGMTATIEQATFVFVTLDGRKWPKALSPRMVFQEAEGTTLIVERETAQRFDLAYEFPCRMITLNVHSSLEAVGFIARIAQALADANMGVNPVAGFYHDHLFVPESRAEDALNVLQTLSDGS